MKLPGQLASFFVCLLIALSIELVSAKESKRPLEGLLITIHTPHPQQLEMVLDEIELDWSHLPNSIRKAFTASANAVAGTRLEMHDDKRAIFSVSGASDLVGLWARAQALKATNPNAEAHLVLYEPGIPKSNATRRLLTREIGLLLEEPNDLKALLVNLAGVAMDKVRKVPGVPGGYVLEAEDPISALQVAETLRQQNGVRSASPLLRRQLFTR